MENKCIESHNTVTVDILFFVCRVILLDFFSRLSSHKELCDYITHALVRSDFL